MPKTRYYKLNYLSMINQLHLPLDIGLYILKFINVIPHNQIIYLPVKYKKKWFEQLGNNRQYDSYKFNVLQLLDCRYFLFIL